MVIVGIGSREGAVASGARLVLADVSKRFGGVHALRHVSFGVEAGDLVSIIGPNGAGKTTLLNVITGLIRADSGSIRLDERELVGKGTAEIVALGAVRTFQLNRVFERMTALENVMVGRHIRTRGTLFEALLPGERQQERQLRDRAHAYLRLVGLEAKANELAVSLSYGQKRLLELARALAAEPKVLLLDEPAAGLHHETLQEVHTLIQQINAGGTTVLLIEHRMPLVLGLSRRIVVLNEGEKIAEGPPEQVMEDPTVIKAYLGRSWDAAAN